MSESNNWNEYRLKTDKSKVFYARIQNGIVKIDESSKLGIKFIPVDEFNNFADKVEK